MSYINNVEMDMVFLFMPRKTRDNGWMWFQYVYRIEDDNPLIYMGMTEEYTYFKSFDNAMKYYNDYKD
jgi:hypothetical protein